MGCGNNFTQGVFVHEEQVERKKESLELVKPWRDNYRAYWSVFGVNWIWILKSQVVRSKE
jgi:hypothetical protein